MADYRKKKLSVKGRILTIIVGIIGIIYWLISKAENTIEALYEDID